jgi:hypothetical protein
MSWLAHSPTAASLPLHRTVRAVEGSDNTCDHDGPVGTIVSALFPRFS